MWSLKYKYLVSFIIVLQISFQLTKELLTIKAPDVVSIPCENAVFKLANPIQYLESFKINIENTCENDWNLIYQDDVNVPQNDCSRKIKRSWNFNNSCGENYEFNQTIVIRELLDLENQISFRGIHIAYQGLPNK